MGNIERSEAIDWQPRSLLRKLSATDPGGAAERLIAQQDEIRALRQQLEGAVEERDALRLMLGRLLDVALVDGYGETAADEARALLGTIEGQ